MQKIYVFSYSFNISGSIGSINTLWHRSQKMSSSDYVPENEKSSGSSLMYIVSYPQLMRSFFLPVSDAHSASGVTTSISFMQRKCFLFLVTILFMPRERAVAAIRQSFNSILFPFLTRSA